MTQLAFEPIPPDLRAAFREAVWQFSTRDPSAPEVTIRIKDLDYSMSGVCALMTPYSDPLPEDIVWRLDMHILPQHAELSKRLGAEPTYSVGGYCLLQLIKDRKDAGQAITELPPITYP